MINVRIVSFTLAATLSLVLSPASWAQDDEGYGLTIVPTLGFQWKNLDLSQTWISTDNLVEKGGIDATLPTYSVGLSLILDRWQLSVRYEDVLEGTTGKSDVPLTNTTFNEFFSSAPNAKVSSDVERKDLSITLGYNVWQELSLFTGYNDGETTLIPDQVVCAGSSIIEIPGESPGTTDQVLGCDPNDEATVPYLTELYVPGSSTYKQTYREDGWFFGASYAWFIGPGTFSVTAAYADMDGRYTDNFGDAAANPENVRLADLSGDSTGTSINLRWSAPLSDRVSYYLDLRQQRYDLDSTSDFSIDPLGQNSWREKKVTEVRQKEKLTGFTMGITLAL